HSFSGAVMDPVSLKELFPNYKEMGCPIDADVVQDAVYYLSKSGSSKSPFTPPPFHNKGKHIVSISKINRWLGEQAEAMGINIFPGFPAVEALYDDNNNVIGVRTGDKGLDKNGNPKGNFEPGMLLKSKLTIFAEGPRGSLFKQVSKKLDLRKDKNEEVFEEGVKEIIQMPAGSVKPGVVIHTLGFPLYKSIGGTFIYSIPGDKIILGLVGYLDTKDPLFDPHRELQKLKTHPFLQKMLKGGKVVAYGGKVLPAGGWYSVPKLYHGGMLVVGDSASMVDVQKLKGIHLAMKSGMLAGDAAFEAILKQDFSEGQLSAYEQKIKDSFVKKQLYRVRNFHQTLSKGVFASMPLIALQEITGGRGLFDNLKVHKDREYTKEVKEVWGEKGKDAPENQLPKPDNVLFFDKLSSVFMAGSIHDEDSPNHLLVPDRNVCADTCHPKYNSPCNHFCPANVYEMVPDDTGKKNLVVNYTNCIHCKTCDIKCPFDNITWTTPEGGGGPAYTET
ncbi:MAG: electron transfer flavoprotein-ubiquinone oxidoreductase, partial [Bdellovibrionales bacterium]|nr:electron transfer flavoprotein-ubiquinone oxidoreductase [Bdellovibrionales bacterium]